MKVALSFPGCHRRGGVERIVFECARFLSGRGHDVTVYAGDWEPDATQPVRYCRVPHRTWPGFLRGPSYYRQCSRRISCADFDVLNTHGSVCPTGGVHWVQSLHRAWLERSKQFRQPLSAARLRQRVNPLHPLLLRLETLHFGGRNYRKVIATTEEVKADLGIYYGVPPDDVVVIPNGFSQIEFSPQRRAERRDVMRQTLGLKPDDIALLFVANELDRKGYDTILSAMKQLGRPDLKLIHVGRPPAAEVMRRAEAVGLSGQVLARGPTPDVSAFHAAADVFVLPTQYEAYCLAILEALGSGLPVVTSNVPGARDAVQPGVNGLLVNDPKDGEELASALGDLLSPARRHELSAVAPSSVASHHWPVVLGRYEKVLMECRS